MNELNYYTSNELYHYGVIGMKWGVRRGHADKAYAKASRKLERIDNKTSKIQSKMNKKIRQAAASTHPNSKQAIKRKQKIKALSRKSIRSMRKAERFYKKMDKVFSKTPIQMTQKQIDIGKQYAKVIEERSHSMMVDNLYR